MTVFKDYITSNILNSQIINNTKCFQVKSSGTELNSVSTHSLSGLYWLEPFGGWFSWCCIVWSIPEMPCQHPVLLIEWLCSVHAFPQH